MLSPKVEIGLDLGQSSPIGFKLDDPIRGQLDNITDRLGGTLFYDITDRIRSISTRRGKNEALDRIDAGVSSIVVDNTDRLFDPLYEPGLYYGQLVPRRAIRVSANDLPVFFGYVEDFDLDYQPGNRATVRIDVADAFSILTNSIIEELDPPSELSGARVNRVLELPETEWPADKKEIDPGNSLLLDTSVAGESVLSYLQTVTTSEFGNLFISKDGGIIFKERNAPISNPDLIFSDDPAPSASTKIPFLSVSAVYGSENLFTRIELANTDFIPEEVIVENVSSSIVYGTRNLSITNLLVQDPDELSDLANLLLATYSEPLYRFDAVGVSIDRLTTEQITSVLELEIGDIVQVRFLPSGIPPAIELPCRIIGISHNWEPTNKKVSFSLETINLGLFVLDSPLFGQLDDDRLGY
jgi:hypothetical protein